MTHTDGAHPKMRSESHDVLDGAACQTEESLDPLPGDRLGDQWTSFYLGQNMPPKSELLSGILKLGTVRLAEPHRELPAILRHTFLGLNYARHKQT